MRIKHHLLSSAVPLLTLNIPLSLALAMVDAGRDKQDADSFALAMDQSLGEFEFPDDFIINVWSVIDSIRN